MNRNRTALHIITIALQLKENDIKSLCSCLTINKNAGSSCYNSFPQSKLWLVVNMYFWIEKQVVSTCVLPLVEFLFYIVSTECRLDLKNQTTLPFECLHLCRSLTILLCGSHGNFISQISLRSIPSLIFLLYLTVKEHLQTQHFGTLCVLLFLLFPLFQQWQPLNDYNKIKKMENDIL